MVTSLMPVPGVEQFTGSNGTTLVNTNWTMPTNQGSGGSWTIQGNQGRLRTGTSNGNRSSVRVNRANTADAEAVFEWTVPTAGTQYAAFYARSGPLVDGDGGYYFFFDNGSAQIELGKWVPNYNGVTLSTISYSFTAGIVYKMRIAIFGSRIRMRMWPVANTEVTSTWDMDFTDSGTQPTTGSWGFTTSSASAGSKDFFIDNFNLLDTITPSQATISVGGSITATGVFKKNATKNFAGSITATGAFAKIKVVAKTFAGSITATGAFTKNATKAFAGTITPAGAFKKNATKKFAGSITPAGALIKKASKKFAGSITPAGVTTIMFVGRIFGYPGILIMKITKPGYLRARFRRG